MNLIDTHCHYNSYIFNDLSDEINKLTDNKNISKVVNVGLDYSTSKEVMILCQKYSKLYASLGVHPLYDGSIYDLELLYNNYDNSKVVAIGEVGIDTSCYKLNMIYNLIDSINLANKLKLPLIIHANTIKGSSLNANKMVIEILKRNIPKYGFVFHSFQPDLEILASIISLGGYIGIGPMILKKNAKKSLEIVKNIDISRILIETDYPYLTKYPDIDGVLIFNKICDLRNIDKNIMSKQLDENAKRLFYKLKNK